MSFPHDYIILFIFASIVLIADISVSLLLRNKIKEDSPLSRLSFAVDTANKLIRPNRNEKILYRLLEDLIQEQSIKDEFLENLEYRITALEVRGKDD